MLVVGVFIIIGLLYQLNSAFKTWANNYFGDYLTCLLETGDLPSIGGSPGDSGICEQFFTPFTWAGGRPRSGGDQQAGEKDQGGPGRGASERGGGGGGSPVRYNSGGGGGFGRSGPGTPTRAGRKIEGSTGSTGNTSASGYGGGYTYYQRPNTQLPKSKLDKKFAFQDQRERQLPRALASAAKKDEGGVRGAIKLKQKKLVKDAGVGEDAGFSLGNFIRMIIIVCIVLALLLFIGGQVLSISKSMER